MCGNSKHSDNLISFAFTFQFYMKRNNCVRCVEIARITAGTEFNCEQQSYLIFVYIFLKTIWCQHFLFAATLKQTKEILFFFCYICESFVSSFILRVHIFINQPSTRLCPAMLSYLVFRADFYASPSFAFDWKVSNIVTKCCLLLGGNTGERDNKWVKFRTDDRGWWKIHNL